MQAEILKFTTLIRKIIYKRLRKKLNKFIRQNYEGQQNYNRQRFSAYAPMSAGILEEFISEAFNYKQLKKYQEPTFSETLFKLIDERGYSKDSQVYKKVGIDRRLFSKIRSHPDYKPAKTTVILLAIALELDIDETKNLLKTAGYTLSRSIMQDLIVEFFISKKIYDVMIINEALYNCGEKTLGV